MIDDGRFEGGCFHGAIHHGAVAPAERIRPRSHLCHADRLAWFEIDNLPRVPGNTLPHPDQGGQRC